MTRLIMHLDMDAFFAAVEQRDNPEFRGKPVVVGAQPGGRGVAATCSYEAREFGIRSAMPINEAYRRCPDAIFVTPSMERYAEASRLVMACLNDISPAVEPVSIDEAYVDISGLQHIFGTPYQIGQRTKAAIKEKTGLTASVGIGPNRLIAKLASDYDKPDGLTYVPKDEVLAFLSPMPLGNLRGIGKKTLPKVESLDIKTIGELRDIPLGKMRQVLGIKMAKSIWNQARGIASDAIHTDGERKSISKETTFSKDQIDQKILQKRLRRLAADVGKIARSKQLAGHVVALKVRLDNFETLTRQRRLENPTQSDKTIFETAWSLYLQSGVTGRPVRLIGAGISAWGDIQDEPIDLFDSNAGQNQDQKINKLMDRVNERFGESLLNRGAPRAKKD